MWKLKFEKLGRRARNVEIIVNSLTESELNPKIQRYLISRDWNWEADLSTMRGRVMITFYDFPFTIEQMEESHDNR